MIIYDNTNGIIVSQVPDNQDINILYKNYPIEFRNRLSILLDYINPLELNNCKVVNGNITKMEDIEIYELNLYGKILTSEERNLNKLKPSINEIKKAQTTIETLNLIQEVMNV